MKFLIAIIFFTSVASAQLDSAITVPLLGINIGGQVPFGDMAKRFGPNLKSGGSFMVKTNKNWIIGAEFNYLFGRNVREDVLKQLKNSQGVIIDNEGYPADLRVTERGMGVYLTLGRVFKLASANPNSGLMINLGGGYMQHRINFYDAKQVVAGVRGDLGYGLDRLTSGFSISQFVGYLFLSDNRLLNFYAGFECYQAFTTSVRRVNYDTGLPDTQKRLDVLGGFRFGWILPLYRKKPNAYYYN
jgi:hypothetical protein